MLELLLNLGSFMFGMAIGKAKAVNIDIVKQTEHMQNLIDEAYEKRDAMKHAWLDAEEKAETWQRRYWNLIDQEESENE